VREEQEAGKKLHNEQLHDLYSSSNIFQKIRWEGHVARTGRRETHTGFWWGNLKVTYQLEDLCVGESIILKQIDK
jgi:hypothetical protein